MQALGVRESDIIEKFIRSSAKGGQKVNKTSSCVYLRHLPTGIEVKCKGERYQNLNRVLARKILLDKIQRQKLKKAAEEKKRIAKLKRQKRKRSSSAKEKMLKAKRRHSEKKKIRAFRLSKDELMF